MAAGGCGAGGCERGIPGNVGSPNAVCGGSGNKNWADVSSPTKRSPTNANRSTLANNRSEHAKASPERRISLLFVAVVGRVEVLSIKEKKEKRKRYGQRSLYLLELFLFLFFVF